MKKALDIFPECYVDTNLVGYLLGEGVNHHLSCGQVASAMRKGKNNDRFALGIVDDDKSKSPYVDEFASLAKTDHLELLKHPEKHHYFIVVSKAAEEFIINAADEVSFDMTEVNLSNELETLKKTTKRCQSNENKDLRKAFASIKQSSEMKVLRNALKYLEQNKMDSDDEVLKQIFQNPDYNIWNN